MEVTGMGEWHGKVGNLIFYTRNGRTFARRVAVPGRKRKPRTERQRAVATRFRTLQGLYSWFSRYVSAEIWRAAARARGRGELPQNVFHSLNCECFDGEGRLVKPELFWFAEGELAAPGGVAVERLEGVDAGTSEGEGMEVKGTGDVAGDVAGRTGDDEGVGDVEGLGDAEGRTGSGKEGTGWFRVRWDEEEGWSTASGADRLRVGVIYEDEPRVTTRWVEEVEGRRGDGEGRFRVRTDRGAVHAYVFFEREDGGAWSRSVYARVP